MKRHVIIGRFGSGDRSAIPHDVTEVATRFDLVGSQKRLEHGIGRALDDLAKLGVFPSEIGVDLLVLATHVYAADTRISRKTESQDTWTREIRLVVPVSDVAVWTPAIPTLKCLLDFLTGDKWTINFRNRPLRFETTVSKNRPLSPHRYDSLALFSGGLDSLIGAIDSLENGACPLFVSHAGEGATSKAQEALFSGLQAHYKRREFSRLRVWTSIPTKLIRGVRPESSTRGRSFLFFAAGAFAGSGFNRSFTLRAPENGLIALNVPLDPLRLGSLSTRTTHPFYMARWNELLRILGIRGKIENPYWSNTKGEMVAGCGNLPLLRALTPVSLSCASPNKVRWLGGRSTEHCGYCLPCLIRRASLNHGLGKRDNTSYTVDIVGKTLDTSQAEGKQARSFQFAIDRLRANPQLSKALIHKPGPLTDESPARQRQLADVYRRGLEEVGVLLARVRTVPG